MAHEMGLDTAMTPAPHQAIHEWMLRVIESRGDEKFDDLHIDQIDGAYRDKSTWVRGGRACLAEALRIRDEHRWPYMVGLGVGLVTSPAVDASEWTSFEQASALFDDTPPSLYLFEPGREPWTDPHHTVIELGSDAWSGVRGVSRAVTLQWYHELDDENRRSLWLVG